MSAKMGRPLSDKPKHKNVACRLDSNGVKLLEECCLHLDKSKSDVLRYGLDLVAKEISKSE